MKLLSYLGQKNDHLQLCSNNYIDFEDLLKKKSHHLISDPSSFHSLRWSVINIYLSSHFRLKLVGTCLIASDSIRNWMRVAFLKLLKHSTAFFHLCLSEILSS